MDVTNFPEEISKKYDIIQEIGRGAFSVVYKIKSKIDNKIYCLKRINMKKTPDKENEINILSKLDHQNLVKYYYSYLDNEGVYIVMEFCEYGDLFSLLQSVKKKKVYVNEEIIWDVAMQTLLALEYLHAHKIIHRDIKLLNLFMSKDKSIKIGDMGMSKFVKEDEMNISRVGTPLYLAPELIKKEKYDYKIDIWSFGCSLYHLAKTSPPFNEENLIKLGECIINDQPTHLPSCYSHKLYEFILKLMTKNKNKRPSASEALKLIPNIEKRKLNLKINNNLNHEMSNDNLNNNKTISNDGTAGMNSINDDTSSNNNNKKNDSLKNNDSDDNKIDKKFNEKCLISGQTFYKYFKQNPEKKKIINNNISSNKAINYKNKKNDFILLSKTMSEIKENLSTNKNKLNIKLVNNNNLNNQMKIIEEEEKKEDLLNNNNNNNLIKEETILNDNNRLSKKNKINIENDRYKLTKNENKVNFLLNNNNNLNNNISNNFILNGRKNYFSERKEKLMDKKEEYIIKDGMRTFVTKDNYNLIYGNKIFNLNKKKEFYELKNDINESKVISSNKNKNNDVIFPIIMTHEKRVNKSYNNKVVFDNNNNILKSSSKIKYYPDVLNKFRKTVNNHAFMNKLTIHDLK